MVFLAAFITLGVMFMMELKEARADIAKPEFQDKLDSVGLPPTRILTADGVELYRVSSENRMPIGDIADVPEKVRYAFLAAEDKRFYDHPGVDVTGLARAATTAFKDGRVSQGGSTLTMQLSKLLFTSSDRSFSRKIKDIAYALALEESKTKDQILLLYLNKVYFGETAHGLKAAASVYFNKDYRNLTVGEAAMLARSVQLPSRYNPIKTPKKALENRNVVLNIMHTEHWLTDKEYKNALAEVPKVNRNPPVTTAVRADFGQHFAEHVFETLEADEPDIDYKQGGYIIHTTINSGLQKLAEASVRQVVRDSRGQRVNQGAFVLMNDQGKILAEVGGVDFHRSQYNIISQGKRQPGSAFKAIVYATAFATGNLSGPNDSVSNAPIHQYDPYSHRTWSPVNASRRENASRYSVRTAFAASINRPAIHTLLDVGPRTVIQYAKDVFGIESPLFAGGPLALGSSEVRPLEMLQAYSVFMSHGDRITPYPIDYIESSTGEIIRRYDTKKYVGVLSSNVCDEMDELTRAVVTSGTGRAADVVPNARGKTGTTNQAKDAWFCGYTDGLVGVAWVGNEQIIKGVPHALPMASSVFGGTVAAKIWARVMQGAYPKFHHERIDPDGNDEATRLAARSLHHEEDVPAISKDDSTDDSEDIIVPSQDDPPADPDPNADANADGSPKVDPAKPAPPPAETKPPNDEDRQKQLAKILADERERDRKREEAARARANAQPEMVRVEVCADSGDLANDYCPETVIRTFPKGKAPTRRCRIHGR